MELFHGVHLHVATIGASAVVGGSGDEIFVGTFLLQAVKHAGLGDHDDVLAGGVLAEADHLLGGTHFIGKKSHCLGALGVSDDEGIGILFFDFMNGVAGEFHVHVAIAFPEVHLAAGLLDDPLAEVLVRNEEDGAVGGSFFDNESGVAGGADDIAERLSRQRSS